jgi:hypothetical protein
MCSSLSFRQGQVDALKKSHQEVLAGKLRWTSRANCWPAGVPEFLLYANGVESIYVMQTPKAVLMIYQVRPHFSTFHAGLGIS